MTAAELLTNVETAFDDIKRPGTSLRQFKLTDEKGMSGVITEKEWHQAGKARQDLKWQEIPEFEIEECGCLLAHMQPEEYLYYLPAYLHYIVSHHEQSGWENDIVNFIIFSLCPSDTTYDYSIFQHSLLTQEQRLVVVAFLKFIKEHVDSEYQNDVRRALEVYWCNPSMK